MTAKELEYVEQRMQQKWHDLVEAEQRGVAMPVLERMYNAYMLAVEEFNRCSSAQQREQQSPAKPKPTKKTSSAASGKKKAS